MTHWQGTDPDHRNSAPDGDLEKTSRKKALREALRKNLAGKSGDSPRVVQQVIEYLETHPHLRVVALFAPMPDEVDLLALTKMTGKIWAFPKVTKDGLIFLQVKEIGNDLEPGAFGILEPKDHLPLINTTQIDLFLCPGLGFDTRGGRIGRGKGFYDAALAKARPDAIRLGTCFEYQLVNEVVMEEHDIRMHGVISG